MTFAHPGDSHNHSLETLNILYEYDDFMGSIRTMVDLGCGPGDDLEWWATRTTRDEIPEPLNIQCTGVDVLPIIPLVKQYRNINYKKTDFESDDFRVKQTFDVLWCHDAFQYAVNPIKTLSNWWHIASTNAMLVIIVPDTLSIRRKVTAIEQPLGCYYHYSVVNLMHMLAVSGWDCASGFFKRAPNDSWIHAVVYKSEHAPMDPKTTTLYDLVERKLFHESAEKSILAHQSLRQQDLVLPWLDKSVTWFGKQ